MEKRSKGQIESLVSESIIKFEKEYMGRGPMETKTYIIKDMVFVRLKGVLTPAEEQLTKSPEGADLIKKTRVRLLEGARILLENIIAGIYYVIFVLSILSWIILVLFTVNLYNKVKKSMEFDLD